MSSSAGVSSTQSVALLSGEGDGGDANSALKELDKGLWSGRLGEQCEAVVRFPRLFAKYPFPILINSALLKLADVFRQGPNFIKLCVLRVIQQSERHLDKITSVDEFVRRIFTVLHSNDPAARALTLRTLGAIAAVVPERKQVHHNVRSALDSHDDVELRAAIFAAGRLAAVSGSFAVNICGKVSEMIRGLATPLDVKLRLVPIFEHMHHDAQTAASVRRTCVEMLPEYPSEGFVCVTLHTLTLLAARTLVDVPDQVELLLRYLNDDPRMAVKTRAIKDLRYLANEERAHLWTESNVSSVVSFSMDCQMDTVLVGALAVLNDLVDHHTSVDKFALADASSPVLKLCQNLAYRNNLEVAAGAVQLLCSLATVCRKDMHHVEGLDVSAEAVMAAEALFLLLNSGVRTGRSVLKDCLRCVVTLCRVHQEACDQFVDIAGGMLLQADSTSGTCHLICELLSSLANLKRGVLKPLIPDLEALLQTLHQRMASALDSERADLHKTLTLLANMLYQTFKGHSWKQEVTDALWKCIGSADAWTRYRLARGAARYGHHEMAAAVVSLVSEDTASEQMYFWVRGLAKIFKGEEVAQRGDDPDLVERATASASLILKGSTSIKAATSPYKSQEFQINYLKCRCVMLEAISQLLLYCNSLRTSPPPAIASTQAKQAKDDLQRCGRITTLLRQSVREFAAVAEAYGELHECSCFDADPDTLAHVQLLQQLNSCVSQWIEMVCLRGSRQGSIYQDVEVEFSPVLDKGYEEYCVEIQDLIRLGDAVSQLFRVLSGPLAPPPISDAHTDVLYRACAVMLGSPLCYPRFFFQTLQQTSLKLVVTTPTTRAPGEPVGASTSQQLAVKVEGVIATAKKTTSWRTVESVEVSVASTLMAPAKSHSQQQQPLPESQKTFHRLTKSVTPHNDFFSAQFLIPFPVAGSHQVAITTRLQDSDQRVWSTGQKEVLNIKAFEDGQNRPSAQGGGGTRGANR